jgi:phospholipid/cholesterol/gamma-HCH transport system substrate-binding protein
MEDRAKYVLIGVFTFAVIAGVFGFVYWLSATSSSNDSTSYRVIFSGAVVGLRVGAPVLFNGIRVGEVSDLRLTDNPAEVAATLVVNPKTPIRADTLITLDYAGLTGIASVSMKGNLISAAPLKSKGGEPPTLRAQATSGDMSSAVRETLAKADAVIAENQESLHNTIKNLETFSAALARNSENLDKLLSTGTEAVASFKELSTNLDQRTATITTGVNTLTATATKQIDVVGNDAHRAIVHIDKAVTDLADHPQRILFGGKK